MDPNTFSETSGLSAEELELLAYMLEDEGVAIAERQTIFPREQQDQLPLSFAQSRLWFLDQLAPGLTAYNDPFAIRLHGRLDGAALERTLNEVVQRHEALRTTFPAVNGQPVQKIAPTLTLDLPLRDLQHLPPADREAEVYRLATQAAQQPFDLARGPLIVATLLRLAPDEHVLLLTIHHIVFDGWSVGVLLREVMTLYDAFAAGQPSPLPPLAIQYADFALWQREWLHGPVLEQQLAYWRRQLGTRRDGRPGPPILELPTDRPRPPHQTHRGAHCFHALPPALVEALNELSQREGATLFMTLLAAFNIVLYRYSGQDDIVVGTPIANRDFVEIERLIGFFVNTLLLRTDLGGQPSFRTLLGRVRETTFEAYAHQNIPFEQVADALQPERSVSHHPLFQVMFVLQNAAMPSYERPDLRMTFLQIESGAAMFDLLLAMVETETGLNAVLEYNTDLFDAATMQRLLDQYEVVLTSIAADPDQPISRLPLLTEAERQQLLVDWNATDAPYPQDRCLHQLVEDQAARTPDTIAVVGDAEQVSYRELNQRANHLAHYLRRMGVGPDTLVGICLERSPALIVGILGILKAGGAYVPLDPQYPAERLAFMLADSQAPLLLTEQRLPVAVPTHNARVVCLDAEWDSIARESAANPCWHGAGRVTPDHLAYIIYTSGSVGQPKGVLVPHRAVVNYITSLCDQFAIGSADSILQFASISFDTAAEELYACLTRGATLVLRTEALLSAAPTFFQACDAAGLTILDLPTAYWHQLTAEIAAQQLRLPPALRLVLIGGEPALAERVMLWQQRVGGRVRLVNTYGPTEATIVATWWELPDQDDSTALSSVPIGRPIRNAQVYVLDQLHTPVPVGVPGELSIGGVGVARGYLGRPGLTAEKFVPNPFAEQPGARLYRTGDLVRYRADGHLEFLGRTDDQVKIRGFRVEPGEIEAVLLRHPAIREIAVVAREAAPGDPRLVAYVVPVPATEAGTGDGQAVADMNGADIAFEVKLRQWAVERLPDYMLPTALVLLDALPLTPSGKVDRNALPTPDWSRRPLDQSYVAPRTPTEALLASIWTAVLERPQVGVEDSFFDLGGHSLLATQVIARTRSAFGIDLPVRAMFEQPTISTLAQVLDRARHAAAPPITSVARTGGLPLSFAQQRLWFLEQLTAGAAGYTIPLAVRLTGSVQLTALQQSFDALVQRHDTLHTTFALVDGQPMQHVGSPAAVRLATLDLRASPAAERLALAQQHMHAEAQRPFDLTRGPLMRVTLVQLDSDAYVLLVTLHHIIADGWSIGVLVRDLAALYAASTQGLPATLPTLPIQYGDFAVWQRQWLAPGAPGDVLERQLAYWRQQLAGAPDALELPTDYPRPAMQTFHGAAQHLLVPPSLSAALTTLSQQAGVTLFMTLLAAFDVLLYRYSGQTDIVVGTPIAGRTHAELEGLIGFFINTLVLRTDLTGNPTFRELLDRVRRVTLAAYEHQDVPFEMLVEQLQPTRDLSRSPLFQVMLILQNTPPARLDVPGLTLEPLAITPGTAKFDLVFSFTPQADGLVGLIEYNTDLFAATTIMRLVAHFEALLGSIVANPAQRITDVPMLTEAERHTLLVDWNATAAPYPQDRCAHQLFEAQAARTPDALAVQDGTQHLTYGQLDARANQVAHLLRQHGVGAETCVALMLDRSVPLVVAALAVLKAGGAYVPLDPALPPARLAFLLNDCRALVLLTVAEHVPALPPTNAQVCVLDTVADHLATLPATPLGGVFTPEQVAYAIYTSGSTGTPKGVLITQQSLLNLVAWHQQRFRVTAQDRATLLAGVGFDASVWELWPYLTCGASLHIPDAPIRSEPTRLRDWLVAQAISLSFVPTPLAELLVPLPWSPDTTLRSLLTGGDTLHQPPPPGLPFTVINNYGPTESTVVATSGMVLPEADAPLVGPPAIGHPIRNTQVYVLDQQMQLVPVGALGELYIGGAGLARGYSGRPDLTAEKFVPNPFAAQPGARLYHTGDLARYRADGQLEFRGRRDQQVKVRGYRIELGEITAVLRQHPAVRAAVVVARTDATSETRLVAYVVPVTAIDAEASDGQAVADMNGDDVAFEVKLHRWALERLPDYMLPTALVLLDALPLTPSGKVDRNALPTPDWSRRPLDQSYVAPRTPTEEAVAALSAQVLGVERVGIHDNFFALGGHSLLATQLIARLRETFQVDLPLRTLFETPTVVGLAERIEMSQWMTQSNEMSADVADAEYEEGEI